MLIPLSVLAVGAVLAGIVFADSFIGHHYKDFWQRAIFELPGKDILHHMHEAVAKAPWIAWSPFVAMLGGLALAWLFYIQAPGLPAAMARTFRPIYLFLLNKWYFDELYDWLFVRPAKALGRFLWKGGDGAIIDGTINGTAASVGWATGKIVRLQTGYVYHYAFAMLIGVALIVTWVAWPAGVTQ